MPTVDVKVAASPDDGWVTPSGGGTHFNAAANNLLAGILASNAYEIFARFLNVAIPKGATIDVAFITVQAKGTGNDGAGTKTNIHFNAADDAVAPTTQPLLKPLVIVPCELCSEV